MFQRGSTYVMSVAHGVKRVFGGSFTDFYEIHMATRNLFELGLYYEGGPPPDVADRINASFPNYLQKPLHRRIVVDIENEDRSVLCPSARHPWGRNESPVPTRETLDGLRRVGFRLNTGIDGSGFLLLAWSKAGGYYFGAHTTPLRSAFPDRVHWHPLTRNINRRRRREPADNRWEDQTQERRPDGALRAGGPAVRRWEFARRRRRDLCDWVSQRFAHSR